MNRAYRKGADFERYFIKKMLSTDDGHILAVRSAGSHGVVDVIEIYAELGPNGRRFDPKVRCYQLKTGKKFVLYDHEIGVMKWLAEMGIESFFVWRPYHCGHSRIKIMTPEEAEAIATIRVAEKVPVRSRPRKLRA